LAIEIKPRRCVAQPGRGFPGRDDPAQKAEEPDGWVGYVDGNRREVYPEFRQPVGGYLPLCAHCRMRATPGQDFDTAKAKANTH
jgi:hypothetical protein